MNTMRRGNMTCQRNAVGDAMRYEYEGRLIVKETWRNGLEWHFEYDGKHIGSKCIHTWGSGGIYDHKLKYKDGGGGGRRKFLTVMTN